MGITNKTVNHQMKELITRSILLESIQSIHLLKIYLRESHILILRRLKKELLSKNSSTKYKAKQLYFLKKYKQVLSIKGLFHCLNCQMNQGICQIINIMMQVNQERLLQDQLIILQYNQEVHQSQSLFYRLWAADLRLRLIVQLVVLPLLRQTNRNNTGFLRLTLQAIILRESWFYLRIKASKRSIDLDHQDSIQVQPFNKSKIDMSLS